MEARVLQLVKYRNPKETEKERTGLRVSLLSTRVSPTTSPWSFLRVSCVVSARDVGVDKAVQTRSAERFDVLGERASAERGSSRLVDWQHPPAAGRAKWRSGNSKNSKTPLAMNRFFCRWAKPTTRPKPRPDLRWCPVHSNLRAYHPEKSGLRALYLDVHRLAADITFGSGSCGMDSAIVCQ
jgi:hypothetical protein